MVRKRPFFAAAAFTLGLAASLFGVLHSRADRVPKPPMKIVEFAPGTTAATTIALNQPSGLTEPFEGSAKKLFAILGEKHNVTIRFDPMAHCCASNQSVNVYNDKNIILPSVTGLTLKDVLDELCMHYADECKFGLRVRGRQILIGDFFHPPTAPGSYKFGNAHWLMIADDKIAHLLYGPTVNIAVDDKDLQEIVSILREQSGANIAIDPLIKAAAETKLSLTLNDTKMLTVLKIASDMCDVAPAVIDNVFYITTKEKAARIMSETEKNLFTQPKKKK